MIPLFFPSCSTPTLPELARRRSATPEQEKAGNVKDNVKIPYNVTDWDVLNFTDEVQRKLANRANIHAGLRYSSATGELTLATLSGAAKTAGWGAGVASGLGIGAAYLFGLGQVFDAKSHSQAYETAFTAIQKAEASYYLHQLGYTVSLGEDKKYKVGPDKEKNPASYSADGKEIPAKDHLTLDGETLYYRVIKTLKVLDDAIEQKIPALEDLQDSMGESSGPNSQSPAPGPGPDSKNPAPNKKPSAQTDDSSSLQASQTPAQTPQGSADSTSTSQTAVSLVKNGSGAAKGPKTQGVPSTPQAILQEFVYPGGVKNDQNMAVLTQWMKGHGLDSVELGTFLHSSHYSSAQSDAVTGLDLRGSPFQDDAASKQLQEYCWPAGVKSEQNYGALRKWMDGNSLGDVDPVVFIHTAPYASKRLIAVSALHLTGGAYANDAASILLKDFCWPGGKKNDQNCAALRKWMDGNGQTGIDMVLFINTAEYAAPRKTAAAALHLGKYSGDPAGAALEKYCWPSGHPNQSHITALRNWMDGHGLKGEDLVTFIHTADYSAQRKDAAAFLHI